MELIDYEDTVHVVGPGGEDIAARCAGFARPDDPVSAGLGHFQVLLAFQQWVRLAVTTDARLPFERGMLIFADTSYREASFRLEAADATTREGGWRYAVDFSPRGPS